MRLIISFIVLILAMQTVLAAPAPADRAGLQQILNNLPAPMRAQGPAVFYAANLYEYINGGAELFHGYDMRLMAHQELKSGENEVTADIYDMGTPEAAFGVYAAERAPGYKFISMGAEGYQDEGILNFLQDRYYVKLAAFGDGAGAAMEQCARLISQRIGAPGRLPEFLKRLPAGQLKAHTERYIQKAPLGYSYLGPAYLAAYDGNGRESTLLISVAPGASEARDRLERFTNHMRVSGECAAAAEFGDGAIRGKNSYEGELLAQAQGPYLVLLLNPGANAGAILKSALAQLQ